VGQWSCGVVGLCDYVGVLNGCGWVCVGVREGGKVGYRGIGEEGE